MDSATKIAMKKVIMGEDENLTQTEQRLVGCEFESLHCLIESTDKLLDGMK
jgi:hypothetical protein